MKALRRDEMSATVSGGPGGDFSFRSIKAAAALSTNCAGDSKRNLGIVRRGSAGAASVEGAIKVRGWCAAVGAYPIAQELLFGGTNAYLMQGGACNGGIYGIHRNSGQIRGSAWMG